MALMTKVNKLEGKNIGLNKKGGGPGFKNSSLTKSTFKYTINPERMKKVGPTKVIDGVLMYWYTLHVCPRGTYNGLYCEHASPGHAAWKERKASYKKIRKG